MKKTLFSIVIISLFFFVGNNYSQVELKPAIGINFTGYSQDPENASTSAKVGWQLGGTVSFGEKLYGEGGIFWTYKSNEISANDTNFVFSTSQSGVRIPVMVGYHLLGKETDIIGLRAFGGGSMTILSNVDAEGLTKDDFTSPTYGVFLGAGVDLSMFFLDLKYEWSLSDVSSLTSFDVGKSRTFFINGGVRISI
ncbi:MAG: PorT family protein [Ignavibacteriaceae bacterium]|nr:PorT family protein [Ignavibacterium sp.]MCU0412874.1 PorT family protein [Ignavibacteriaceae bacterium]